MSGQYDPKDPFQPAQPPDVSPPTQPGPLPVLKGPDALAITSLVLGVVSLISVPAAMCICPGVGAPLALGGVICGFMSKTRGGMRTAGIICSIIALVGSLLWLAFVAIALIAGQHAPAGGGGSYTP